MLQRTESIGAKREYYEGITKKTAYFSYLYFSSVF